MRTQKSSTVALSLREKVVDSFLHEAPLTRLCNDNYSLEHSWESSFCFILIKPLNDHQQIRICLHCHVSVNANTYVSPIRMQFS